MNQYICAVSELDQILGVPGISGEHYGMPGVVDAIAQGWLDRSVIDGERGDLQIADLVHHTLFNILSHDNHALSRKFFIHVAADVDIELVGLLQMRHHLPCSRRPPDTQRRTPAKD